MRFDGEYQDAGTPLLYLKARYLNQAEGISYFLTRDYGPAREKKKLSDGDYNAFAGNPVRYQDPSGHAIIDDLIIDAQYSPRLVVTVAMEDESQKMVENMALKVMKTIGGSNSYETSELVSFMTSQRKADYEKFGIKNADRNIEFIRKNLIDSSGTFAQHLKWIERLQTGNCAEQAELLAYRLGEKGIDARIVSSPETAQDHVFVGIYNINNKIIGFSDPWLGLPWGFPEQIERIYNVEAYEVSSLSERYEGTDYEEELESLNP